MHSVVYVIKECIFVPGMKSEQKTEEGVKLLITNK